MDLPWDRLCASSNDHFLSVPEALDVLPLPIKNMGTDLLFAPDGPRIRDRIMHGFIQDIPKEFAFCIFALFEKCNIYFDNDDINSIGKWDFAFHPARCLEYELSLCCSELSGLYIDLLRTYNQQIFERLIECAIAIKSIQNCSPILHSKVYYHIWAHQVTIRIKGILIHLSNIIVLSFDIPHNILYIYYHQLRCFQFQ